MVSAIVLAGGRGKRMGSVQSKQYIDLNGKPILYYTLNHFINNKNIDKVILVIPEDELEFCRNEVLDKYNLKIDSIAFGGKERQDSVYNGLKKADGSDIVLIHDGARPFVSERIIEEGIKYAGMYGAAAPGVMPKDTIKVKNQESFSLETPDRNNLVAVQTPQVFDYNIIFGCHKKVKEKHLDVTDDTMVVELFGNDVYLYEGEYTNIKITTPEDLILAQYLVES
ncbi:2-C-methyl-D-erythritol 4-phosphate cytidylyltransferase [Clostridium butyricum]|jgi:2-C-methyl-D-erythritol 4-phosphate cytidylyltransferase|uniref:2-C-methyl-D-erythritol 4-phosphate cytidylyltransferase n=1 Tax=Clostridium butyricum TaxID=1492 RepID=A0A2S7F722_CLOBU|nr:2-C-methyl-D-erythritol 4-phosphate cytidylyltransferase [Clostridium butyricum]MBS5984733.1 2-C-methyl-D-erythritol 4-phosphate cytidylyltransferase [Clostridium butyricum]MDK2828093.1 2-C-methyl-D-erythritol 4-phosphate cytidylyltransferase [Clostridium butyricum]MDU5722045.1 2-C-methyl-D-erythritol 4-phosphate cytidylyltransferase [Clostridium butyricum]NAS19073.1 2-C-methyl-D-erythritol 4-phosphate cytidylyltransferase [Clostridium butyricum]NOW23655.1 2-C-methyl-D-erythritol 4-phosphat